MRRLYRATVALLAAVALTSAPAHASTVVRGPDVSNNNRCGVDWRGVHAWGAKFAFAKANQGSYHDVCFDRNWGLMLHEGLVRGAYDFAEPSVWSGAAEARIYGNIVRNAGGFAHAIAVLDIEAYGAGVGRNRQYVRDWITEVRKFKPALVCIYTGAWWWNPNVGAWWPPGTCDWPSAYGPRPVVPAGAPGWDFWQFTDGQFGPPPHVVTGIGPSDISVFSGDYSRLLEVVGWQSQHAYATRSLHVGSQGTDVRALQLALDKRLVQFRLAWPRIHVDGTYGAATAQLKRRVEYALGFPLAVVRHSGATRAELQLVAHPDRRSQADLARAGARRHRVPHKR